MIFAAFIYFCAHTGLIVAEPVIINTLAAGAIATTYSDKIKININAK